MNYQKAYMNQIFSSSLMGQVAEMWRNQLLCDAIIKTGSTDTKAHRLVLVAACPMLQTMENATIGSHLEVRLSSEIKPESVQTFLKYLYEGFMMLTGDNYKDVEKIAKLLQVESVVRCCVDFSKCLSEKTGVPCEKRFGLGENSDSVYVRSSDLLKVQETVKRHSPEETVSPEGERKRQKTNRPTPPPPLLLPMHNLSNNERVSHGLDMSRVADTDRTSGIMEAEYSPRVIQSSRSSTSEAELMKDSLEIVHREPPDPNNINQSEAPIQQTMGLSVASKIPSDRNTQIVNMSNVLPHSRTSTSNKNLHIHGSPHSSSSSRKHDTAHSMETEPRTPETHKNHDRRHLLMGDAHSRLHMRPNSHDMAPMRKHDSYPSNLPSSEILGGNLHDLSSKSISSTSSLTSPLPSSPYRQNITLPHRHPNAAQLQKSFLQPMFRPGLPFDGRPFPGVPMGSLSHLAGLLPTSMAPPLPLSYNAEDHNKDQSVPNSPCTPSGPDLSIIKTEEMRDSDELHIDIPPEESSASGAASPHNAAEEEPPGDDSSNQGSDGGSLWQDNSVKAQFTHDKYQLWEFIRDLLHDPKYNPSIIQWENVLDGVFRIVDSTEVARLWGKTKKFTKMTYDHMGRAFRYSKTMGYFAELPKGAGYPKKLCFKFGPKAHNWLPFPNAEAPLNLVLKSKTESKRKPTEKRPSDPFAEKSSAFMRRMSELNAEHISRKTSKKSVGQERVPMGLIRDTHRFGMDPGSAEPMYRFQTGGDGATFPPDRPPERTFNIPSFIEKPEELSAEFSEEPKPNDQFSWERSRRASVEESVQETDSLLLLARASTAESAATSPLSSSAEKQTTFDSPEQNQK